MKKLKRILFICLAVLFVLPMSSQTFRQRHSPFEDGDDFHFGYISGSVGYSMLQTRMSNVMPVGGVGGAIGVGYEFRNSGLWANIGLQLSFHRSQLLVDKYMQEFPGLDTQGKEVTLQYHVTQTDHIEWNYLDVPLMVGYYIRGFHVGGGLKISYALNPRTRTEGVYALTGQYEMYPEPFHDMPDRGYDNYTFNNRVENQLNVGASLIGEIGYDLLSSMPTRSRICNILKLAFYFEYGLNTQLRKRENPVPSIQPNSSTYPTPATNVTINPYVNTFATPERTVPFFTGLKLTYMIGSSRTARVGAHHGCMCYN